MQWSQYLPVGFGNGTNWPPGSLVSSTSCVSCVGILDCTVRTQKDFHISVRKEKGNALKLNASIKKDEENL